MTTTAVAPTRVEHLTVRAIDGGLLIQDDELGGEATVPAELIPDLLTALEAFLPAPAAPAATAAEPAVESPVSDDLTMDEALLVDARTGLALSIEELAERRHAAIDDRSARLGEALAASQQVVDETQAGELLAAVESAGNLLLRAAATFRQRQ